MKVNQYRVLKHLGAGAFATVVSAVDESSAARANYVCMRLRGIRAPRAHCAEPQAIKIFSKSALKKKRDFVKVGGARKTITALDKALKELAIMKKMRHENVIRCFEIMDAEDQDELYMGA